MRPRQALVLLSFLAALAGCHAPESERPAGWSKRLRLPGHENGSNLVQLDVALLERPIGDPYLNQELWEATDEQVVSLEQRAVVEDNGFRVGQIVGTAPGQFQALLTSERCCVNPRRRLLQTGAPATLNLGSTLGNARFKARLAGLSEEFSLEKAAFLLEVTPTPAKEGKIRLVIKPQVQHGDLIPDFKASDRSGWSMQIDRPTRSFPGLEWEVVLGPNEYLVIGALFADRGTFGFQAFVQTEHPPLQRLLVLRTGPSPNSPGEHPDLADLLGNHLSPPLAMQASRTSVRAAKP